MNVAQEQPRGSHDRRWSRGAWLLRVLLVIGILYSTFALAFYGWYATFPDPNQGSATLVANIWSVVAIACLAALVASFFQRKQARSGKSEA